MVAEKTKAISSLPRCTQHLTFDQDDVEILGERVLMNPPIRYTEDRDSLWRSLKDGTIDCVGHRPCPSHTGVQICGFP